VLDGISLTCFLFSYLAVLGLELSRLGFRFPSRQSWAVFGMLAALLAHSLFIFNQFSSQDSDRLLGTWFQWTIIAAWGLAVAGTILMVRNPAGNIGLFVVPVILAMLGLAWFVRGGQPFVGGSAVTLWSRVHAVSLLLGTMFICQGLAFAIMYLVQSHRLKVKSGASGLIRLPSLEFLRSMNRLNLVAACLALGVGMLSGIMLNLNRDGRVGWLSSGVLVSLGLFVWSLFAALIEWNSKGSLGGRRGAYLSIASFAILSIVMLFVLATAHGQAEVIPTKTPTKAGSLPLEPSSQPSGQQPAEDC
jgi:hypothetical protein